MTHPSKGLREQLAAATSIGQITDLLLTGQQYTEATPATRRAWVRTAERRQRELAAKK